MVRCIISASFTSYNFEISGKHNNPDKPTTREKINGPRGHKKLSYDELLNALMSLTPEGVYS
jgi:hypothetical protein